MTGSPQRNGLNLSALYLSRVGLATLLGEVPDSSTLALESSYQKYAEITSKFEIETLF